MPRPTDTTVPTVAVEAGLARACARGIITSWRRTGWGTGRRKWRIEWPTGDRETWEVGRMWAYLRGTSALYDNVTQNERGTA